MAGDLLTELVLIRDGVVSALDALPVIPGKIIPMTLLTLSVIAWSVIFSKFFLLYRIGRADRRFVRRLKRSQSCFEVLERRENYAPSAFFQVYENGARSALRLVLEQKKCQFVSLRDRQPIAPGLTPGNLIAIDGGFVIGERIALRKFQSGFRTLSVLSLLVPLLGLSAGVWLVLLALNVDGLPFNFLSTQAMIRILVSMLVTLPIVAFRVMLRNKYRKRLGRISQFRSAITKIFRKELEISPVAELFQEPRQSADSPLRDRIVSP